MTRVDAIYKIQKLLRRSGRTDAEADTATIIAAALAEKHGIDIAKIDQAEQERTAIITHKTVGEWSKIPTEAEYASYICKRFFEVSAIQEIGWTQKMTFVGTDLHLQIAEYVFNYLIHEFRYRWNHRPSKRIRRRAQFIYGCYIALHYKLSDRFPMPANTSALEISLKAKRDAYIHETFGKLTQVAAKQKGNPGVAAQRGYAAGQDIEIRPGVTCTKASPPAALAAIESRLLKA